MSTVGSRFRIYKISGIYGTIFIGSEIKRGRRERGKWRGKQQVLPGTADIINVIERETGLLEG